MNVSFFGCALLNDENRNIYKRKYVKVFAGNESFGCDTYSSYSSTKLLFRRLYKEILGPKITLFLAARLAFYKNGADNVSSIVEAKFIRNCQLNNQKYVSVNSASILPSPSDIKKIRTSSILILDNIKKLRKGVMQEVYIMREFFLKHLGPIYSSIYRDQLLGRFDEVGVGEPALFLYYSIFARVQIFFVFVVFLMGFIVILWKGQKAASQSTFVLWYVLTGSYGVEMIFLIPLRLLFQFFVIDVVGSRSIRNLKLVIKLRSKSIIKRSTGFFWLGSNLIQFVNPAVRAARNCAYLSVSKLLILLNDCDYPLIHRKSTYKYAAFGLCLNMFENIFFVVLQILEVPARLFPRYFLTLTPKSIVSFGFILSFRSVLVNEDESFSLYYIYPFLLPVLGFSFPVILLFSVYLLKFYSR
jgi:hypothetical protein